MEKRLEEVFEAAVNLDFEGVVLGLDSLNQSELVFLFCVARALSKNAARRITLIKPYEEE